MGRNKHKNRDHDDDDDDSEKRRNEKNFKDLSPAYESNYMEKVNARAAAAIAEADPGYEIVQPKKKKKKKRRNSEQNAEDFEQNEETVEIDAKKKRHDKTAFVEVEEAEIPKKDTKKKKKKRSDRGRSEEISEHETHETSPQPSTSGGNSENVNVDEVFRSVEDLDKVSAHMDIIAKSKKPSSTIRVMDFHGCDVNGYTGSKLRSAFMKYRLSYFKRLPLHLEGEIFKQMAPQILKMRLKVSNAAANVRKSKKPKRPAGAFFMFVEAERAKGGHPELETIGEQMKYFGKLWQELKEDEKNKYKARYLVALNNFYEEYPDLKPAPANAAKKQRSAKSFLDLFSIDFKKQRGDGGLKAAKLTTNQLLAEFSKLPREKRNHYHDLAVQELQMSSLVSNEIDLNDDLDDHQTQIVTPKPKQPNQKAHDSAGTSTKSSKEKKFDDMANASASSDKSTDKRTSTVDIEEEPKKKRRKISNFKFA